MFSYRGSFFIYEARAMLSTYSILEHVMARFALKSADIKRDNGCW